MNVRRIRADEGLAYREVRLRALQGAPTAYFATYEDEAPRPDEVWHELAQQGAYAMELATFVVDRGNGDLAGTVFTRVNVDPPHDAYVGAMWLDEGLRGQGWGEALLDAPARPVRPPPSSGWRTTTPARSDSTGASAMSLRA